MEMTIQTPETIVALPRQINLPTISQRWPDIYDELIKTPALEYKLIHPNGGMYVNGKMVTSAYNRQLDAIEQARDIPETQTEVWIYGAAMGDTVNALLSHPNLKHIHVVIMNRGLFNIAVNLFHQPWLRDSRVELHLARDVFNVVFPFIISPAEPFMADRDAFELRDKLLTEVNKPFVSFYLEHRKGIQYKQYLEMKDVVDNTPTVEALFGSWKGYRVAVIMGGPTAKDWFEWIKEEQATAGDLFIICATTCLKPLQDAGILPAIVVCEDPMPCVESHFEGVDIHRLRNSRLVFIPTAHPNLHKNWPWLKYRSKKGIHDLDGGDLLFLGGSVIHTSMDLATKLGAREVYLFGGDLCYAHHRTHMDGTYQAKELQGKWHPITVNGNGDEVYTENNFVQYRQALQHYINAVKVEYENPPKFYKAGKAGVEISGMEWLEDTQKARLTHD